MRKTIFKAAALSVCVGLLLMTVPDLNAVQKKAPKTSFITKALVFINHVLPLKIITGVKLKKINNKVKITGTLSADRVSDGD